MSKRKYEVLFVEDIEEDFVNLNFNENQLQSIINKIEAIAAHPNPKLVTERVMNTPLRKIPFGKYRLFLHIDDQTEVIYCLAIIHHNRCYKPKEIKKVITLLKNIE